MTRRVHDRARPVRRHQRRSSRGSWPDSIPAVARVAQEARAILRRQLPAAFELVYDNYNALAIGFSPTEKTPDAIVSVTLYPRWVSLFFLYGATLPDPLRLLQGSGKQVRSIRCRARGDA